MVNFSISKLDYQFAASKLYRLHME